MRLIYGLLLSVLLTGCAVDGPVKTQSIVDDRPRITLDVSDYEVERLELLIDGLSYGPASQYLNTLHALRIIPGDHIIEAIYNGQIVFETTTYFAEGTLTEIRIHAQ